MDYRYCQRCFLREDHPGVELDGDDVCNLCRLKYPDELFRNFEFTRQNYEEFLASDVNPDAPYDVLLMYSGGKDSTYMLDRFVNQERRRVLAYTFKIPFESDHVTENISRVQNKIAVDFEVDADDENVQILMRYVFNQMQPRQPAKYLDEKLPCAICRSLYVLRAILYAQRRKIPFIVFCADPQQILTTESDVVQIVKNFYSMVGAEVTEELFGRQLEDILFAGADELPKIVFPYIGMRHSYDPGEIVEYLKERDLYSSSPIETHCKLFPLLNFYALKNYGCSFYRLNMASEKRKLLNDQEDLSTFSIEFPKHLDVLGFERRYRDVIMSIVAGEMSREEQESELRLVLKELELEPSATQFLVDNFLDVHEIAGELGVELAT